MTLLAQVVGRLRERGLPCALIGAEVRERLEELPSDCRRLWERLLLA